MDPASAVNRNNQWTEETRREIEKTLIVRQLKTQILLLRGTVAEKGNEIENLKKTQKSTQIVELVSEKEEYYLETLRLKQTVRDLRELLQSERQRRDWDHRMNHHGISTEQGTNRKEASRLSAAPTAAHVPMASMPYGDDVMRPVIGSGGYTTSAAVGRPASAGINRKSKPSGSGVSGTGETYF
jgi:hypothetical protein